MQKYFLVEITKILCNGKYRTNKMEISGDLYDIIDIHYLQDTSYSLQLDKKDNMSITIYHCRFTNHTIKLIREFFEE